MSPSGRHGSGGRSGRWPRRLSVPGSSRLRSPHSGVRCVPGRRRNRPGSPPPTPSAPRGRSRCRRAAECEPAASARGSGQSGGPVRPRRRRWRRCWTGAASPPANGGRRTDFGHDDQVTLVLSPVTGHGRAAALLWLSVWKNELKNQRSAYEDTCLQRLSELLPPGCRVTILADRGFGDQKLFAFLDRLGFGYVIRFRGNIHVTAADGQSKPAAAWVGKGGRARTLRDARVTAKGQQVGAVVCVHAKGMKEPWCLASSDGEAMATTLINHYAKRWTIEPQFRDTKDLQFGMGLSATRIGEPMRRDRLLLISAFATALLTLLGAVGERLGMDRLLKSNTSKTRTHSLFRQGCMLYDLIPNMPEHRLAPLMQAFNEAVAKSGVFASAVAMAK